MRTLRLPAADGSEIETSELLLGMMRIQDRSDAEIRSLLDAATEVGINTLDHADLYGGGKHGCERRFGEAVDLSGARRERLVIQTKCGIVPEGPYFDFSYRHILSRVEGSLRALGTDHVDVLLLHRPDALMEPDEVARAFDDLAAAGKVRAFGVSNHTPGQIELLRTRVRQPIAVNQIQLSLAHAPAIAHGLAANMASTEQSLDRGLGVIDHCRREKITVQAWSPFQSADGSGVFLDHPAYPELNAALHRIAAEHGVTPTGIATAWLTRHPARMQVVLGTTTGSRVAEAAAGAEIELSRPEWYELFRAAGHLVP